MASWCRILDLVRLESLAVYVRRWTMLAVGERGEATERYSSCGTTVPVTIHSSSNRVRAQAMPRDDYDKHPGEVTDEVWRARYTPYDAGSARISDCYYTGRSAEDGAGRHNRNIRAARERRQQEAYDEQMMYEQARQEEQYYRGIEQEAHEQIER